MGNCLCSLRPLLQRVPSNRQPDSRENQTQSVEEAQQIRTLPSNPQEVEELRGSSASNPLTAFSFQELKVMTDNFRQDRFLGEGGFGRVYRGLTVEDETNEHQPLQVAVKVHDGDNSYQGHREWLAEVVYLGQLSHPNLVKLLGYCCEGNHRVLIYEYMSRGSVEYNLFSSVLPPLPWDIRMKIALGAARGLAFLHEADKPIIYRDFKTSNILLDQDYNPKLSDFGLAKEGPVGDQSHVSTRIMGTVGYAAPEYLMTGHLTPRSDVYSFGVVLLEMLTGRRSIDRSRPTKEQSLTEWVIPLVRQKKNLRSIVDPRLETSYPNESIYRVALLAYFCLNSNSKQRPLMREVVEGLEHLQKAVKERSAASTSTVNNEVPVLPS